MRLAILIAAFSLAAAAAGAAVRTDGIEVSGAWSRPAVAGFNGVGYMTLSNHGRRAQALVKVESPAARSVEIHRSAETHGVMSMAPAPRVEIPPGKAVRFAPGAYHLMFLGLKRTLKPGDRLPAVLVFSDGRRIGLDFAVGSGARPGHSDAGG
jgi:copper(I)-binding protein